jgi:alanine-glyoxylate transaminase/serine-glyoxylate transaminase/serine-pyruvate transaminase
MGRAQLINMSCGQTDLYPECLQAIGTQLGSPIYYPAYRELEVRVIGMLQEIMHTHNEILLMAGSATYGIEATMQSLLQPGDKVLTINTGVFGQVLSDIAQIVGAQPIEIRKQMGQSVQPGEVREVLRRHQGVKMVAVVHAETSAGTLNPVDGIAEVLREFPHVLFMVDAVSSLGAEGVRVDDWGIDALCASPQKCFCAPQGIAIVAVSNEAWGAIESRTRPIHSLCLDLTVWRQYHKQVSEAFKTGSVEDASFGEETKAAHGPSPSYVLVKGLLASLDAILAEGLDKVLHRHQVASRAVRIALRAMGLEVMANSDEIASSSETRFIPPEGIGVQALAERMLEHGVAIAGLRIGTMGFAASPKYVLPTIHALEQSLVTLGCDVVPGLGVEAARRAFAEGLTND